jgi:hypothetical protein
MNLGYKNKFFSDLFEKKDKTSICKLISLFNLINGNLAYFLYQGYTLEYENLLKIIRVPPLILFFCKKKHSLIKILICLSKQLY